ncbi:MAG: right-handed parallel beta-helix repeat-containing protein, partial [Victivallaceae bacterium]|nr:right-handed parallel beta-helix repeat-containing protein [Victivallaceae bacterium]
MNLYDDVPLDELNGRVDAALTGAVETNGATHTTPKVVYEGSESFVGDLFSGISNCDTAALEVRGETVTVDVDACTFTGNLNNDNGAMWNNAGSVSVTDSTFTGNSGNRAGAIYNKEGTVSITDNTFYGNSGNAGGAVDNFDQATVSNNVFSSNTAGRGGAIFSSGTATISYGTFSGNSAAISGGAVENQGVATIADSIFDGNAAEVGGALYNTGVVTVRNCVFTTETDTIFNSGTMTFLGENDIDASIQSNNGFFVAEDAVIRFGGAEISETSTFSAEGNSAFIFDITDDSSVMTKLQGFSTIGFVVDAETPRQVSFKTGQVFSDAVIDISCDIAKIQPGTPFTFAVGSYVFAKDQQVALNGATGIANDEMSTAGGDRLMVRMDGESIRLLKKHENPIAIDIKPSETKWTNEDVTMTVDAQDGGWGIVTQEYSVDGTIWRNYTDPVSFSENGTFSFRVVDNSGNETLSSYEVGNIDKVAPWIFISVEPASLANSTFFFTAGFFDNLSGIAVSEYKLGEGDWQQYTAPVEVAENTRVSFHATDNAGNETTIVAERKPKVVVNEDETAQCGYCDVKTVTVAKSVTYANAYGIRAAKGGCTTKLAEGATVPAACAPPAPSSTEKTTISLAQNAALDVSDGLFGIAKLTSGDGCTVTVTSGIFATPNNDTLTIGKTNTVHITGKLDFADGKNALKIGANSTVGIYGGVSKAQSLTIAAGAKDKEKGQCRTIFTAGAITGTANKDKISLGNFSTFTADSINLADGESSITAGGPGSMLDVEGKVSGINSFKTGNGRDASADGAVVVDIGALSLDGLKSNTLAIGKFGTATIGQVDIASKAAVTIGANAVVDMDGGKLDNINKLTVTAGAKYKDGSGQQTQGHTSFDAG